MSCCYLGTDRIVDILEGIDFLDQHLIEHGTDHDRINLATLLARSAPTGGPLPFAARPGEGLSKADRAERTDTLCSFGAALLDMNADAFAVRYDENADDIRAGDGTPCYSVTVFTDDQLADECWPRLAALVKALDSLLYQCSEGDVPERYLLFDEVASFRDRLCHELVRRTTHYARADWL